MNNLHKNVKTLYCYYTKLKFDNRYRRRISWISINAGKPKVVVEYLGAFPGHSKHKNSKQKKSVYIRTHQSTFDKIDSQLGKSKPKKIFDQLQTEAKSEILMSPRNLTQLYNRKRKNFSQDNYSYCRSYPDEILETINMLPTHPFVQKLTHGKNCPTAIVLYHKEQILDLQRFWQSGKSVLYIDKTFNLANGHLTMTVYKNLALLNNKDEHPLFIGPLLIHNKSNMEVFLDFFYSFKNSIAWKP